MNLYKISIKFLLRQVLIFALILSVVIPVVLIQPATTVYADKLGVCGIPGKDGPTTTLNGVLNSYYPGVANVTAGATSIPVGTARAGGGTVIAAGDLLLVVQMQGADLDGSNDERYGDGVGTTATAGNTVVYSGANAYAGGNLVANFSAGVYEYVVATAPVTAGSVTISSGLVNNYFSSPFTTQGQRTFQVVRVPQYSSATLNGTVTALRWDGSTGGIVAFDVAGALNWNGNTVDVSTLGFRGGGGRQLAGGAGVNTDYRTPSTNNANGSKGEGYAGTPRYVNNNGALLDNGVANEGFINGSYGRGASGNGGGGSTDGNPAANEENSGGGGGGNGGFGGMGGNTWNSALIRGGFGGAPFPGSAPRLILGGGGGAGTTNDGTGTPAAGIASSGAAGGGVVMIRAGTIGGIGTVNANGATANQTVLNDGGGGGGAGGSVVVIARNGGGSVGTLTVTAAGGNGGDTWPLQVGAIERHGPGGGGGGGFVFTSGVLVIGSNVSGGLNGISTTANDPFGSTPGGPGTLISNIIPADIPTSISGANCVPVALTTTKTTSTPNVVAGTTATYTIIVGNVTGAGGASGVDISDVLPAGFTYASTDSVTLSANAIRTVTTNPAVGATTPTWGTFMIPGGESVAITLTVNVNAAPPGTYQNPATATFLDPVRTTATASLTSTYDPASSTGEDVTIQALAVPSLTIAKSVTELSYATVGTILHYSYLVTNSGNVILNGPFTVADDKSIDEACPATATLAPGASITCTATYTVTQADLNAGSVTNIASAQGSFNGNPVNSLTDTKTVNAAQNPALIVVKRETSNGPYVLGSTITYNIVVTNNGNITLTGVTTVDNTATVGTCTPAQPASLAPNATMSCPASHVVTQADLNNGSYSNTATGDSDQTPPSNSTVVVSFNQINGLTKNISSTDQSSTIGSDVAIGEIVTYQVSVIVPPGTYSNANLVDTMERGLAFVGCDNIGAPGLTTTIAGGFASVCANPTVDDAGAGTSADVDRRITFGLGTLTNGGQTNATLTVTYRAIVLDIATNKDGTSLKNSAVWSSSAGSMGPAQATVKILEPELTIAKTANVKFIANGSPATFTIVVAHIPTSNTDAFDVVVSDVLPAGLDYVANSITCNDGEQYPDLGTCAYDAVTRTVSAKWTTFTRLPAGDRGIVRFSVIGNASIPANGSVTNVANVEWSSMPGDHTTPQSFSNPSNQFATERHYDPADQFDIYHSSDSLTLTPLHSGGGGGGNSHPRLPVSSAGGFLIPVTGFAPNTVTKLSAASRPAYNATNLIIEIPVIKVNTSIVGVQLKNGDWDISWLLDQIGWLNGTAYPTWTGNSVLTGHVVNADGKPGVFSKLKDLNPGEYIYIYNLGYRYTYKVVSNKSVQPDDITVLQHEDKAYLTLITCDNYDETTAAYLRRTAVRAVLVDVRGTK